MGSLSAGGPDAGGDPTRPGDRATERDALPEAGDDGGIGDTADATTAMLPHTSKLRVLWAVVGVIAIGAVVALGILIPLFAALPSAAGFPTGGPSATPTADPAEEGPSAADRQAAVDAVARYRNALGKGDCEAFFATTTEAYRAVLEIPDCASLTLVSTRVAERIQNQMVTIGEVRTVGDSIAVSTVESLMSSFDLQGNPTVMSIAYENHLGYNLVESSEGWAIDELRVEDPEDDAGDPSGGASAAAPAETPTYANEQAAIGAVNLYNQAWLTQDCDSYFASTTEKFRAMANVVDCATFQADSAGYGGTNDVSSTTIRDVQTQLTAIAVSATESYTDFYEDDDGNPTIIIDEQHLEYYLVNTDGTWRIDDAYAE